MGTELQDYLHQRLGLEKMPAVLKGTHEEPEVITGDHLPESVREEIGLLFGIRAVLSTHAHSVAVSPTDSTDGQDHIVLMIDELLESAVRRNASDLHFETSDDAMLVRFRIDGVLRTVRQMELYQRTNVISRLKVMAGLDITETRRPQDGRMRRVVDGSPYDFRVSTMPAHYGEKIVIRVLDKGAIELDLDELGIQQNELSLLKTELSKPNGLMLVTGPTGSGKTTTLYAALQFLTSDAVNIVTVEDPIEYNIPRVNQSQVNPKIDYGFAQALRHILRQDPDTIMIGEIRDTETLQIAVRASITGHLVLSTLHTNSSIGAIPRLLDLGIQPFMIASCLNLVVAQRLVRRICPSCREEVKSRSAIPDTIEQAYQGTGCNRCEHTGYKGRKAVFEFLPISDDLRQLIKEERSEQDIRKHVKGSGYRELPELMVDLVHRGETSIDEVVRQGYL